MARPVGQQMTLVAVLIAGSTVAVAGYLIEALSIRYAPDSYAQRVAFTMLGAALASLVLTAILLVVAFPDADQASVLGGLIAGYVGGSVYPLLEGFLGTGPRMGFGEFGQLATQALLGCIALLLGAAIVLQL